MVNFTVHTLAERPDLIDETDHMNGAGWPEFMLHDPVADEHFWRLYDTFPEYQSVLVDDKGKVIACGNTIPVTWDGTLDGLPDAGWDAIMRLGVENHLAGILPNAISAIQVVVSNEHLGSGLSRQVLLAMRARAAEHGLNALIAPVRPNLKHRYPLTPMQQYIQWTHTDGLPFDPWLRTHARLGAAIMKVCPASMTIAAPIADWESWTDMRFPESGSYIIPRALAPVDMDLESDTGRYVEANVWMHHNLNTAV